MKQVPDDDPELLRYLGENGVVPHAVLTVVEISPFDGNLKIQVDGQPEPVVLGPSITCEIFVEVL